MVSSPSDSLSSNSTQEHLQAIGIVSPAKRRHSLKSQRPYVYRNTSARFSVNHKYFRLWPCRTLAGCVGKSQTGKVRSGFFRYSCICLGAFTVCESHIRHCAKGNLNWIKISKSTCSSGNTSTGALNSSIWQEPTYKHAQRGEATGWGRWYGWYRLSGWGTCHW